MTTQSKENMGNNDNTHKSTANLDGNSKTGSASKDSAKQHDAVSKGGNASHATHNASNAKDTEHKGGEHSHSNHSDSSSTKKDGKSSTNHSK